MTITASETMPQTGLVGDEVYLAQALQLDERSIITAVEPLIRVDTDIKRHRIGGALLFICDVRGPGLDDSVKREFAVNDTGKSRIVPEDMISRYGAIAEARYRHGMGAFREHIDLRPEAQLGPDAKTFII